VVLGPEVGAESFEKMAEGLFYDGY
jgi:hypothetical protein